MYLPTISVRNGRGEPQIILSAGDLNVLFKYLYFILAYETFDSILKVHFEPRPVYPPFNYSVESYSAIQAVTVTDFKRFLRETSSTGGKNLRFLNFQRILTLVH